MMEYVFFYDETEHSRKVNLNTVRANNYNDNFVTTIIGWNTSDSTAIISKFRSFESKYESRKTKGELKSTTIKSRDLEHGFASLNKNTITFYEDLLAIFDSNVIKYVCVSSKLEYIIRQLLNNQQHHAIIYPLIYSVIKSILSYQPQRVIESIYEEPDVFVRELKSFLFNRININMHDKNLKELENQAYIQIINLLGNVNAQVKMEWDYRLSFDGFQKLLGEMKVQDYELLIDREGSDQRTINAAKFVGLQNLSEIDSIDSEGIRMSDLFAKLISKCMQSLNNALHVKKVDGRPKKILLREKWFELNCKQFMLYKTLHRILNIDNRFHYNTYAGIYADDLIVMIALLDYLSYFSEYNIFNSVENSRHAENFNSLCCERLQDHFAKIF